MLKKFLIFLLAITPACAQINSNGDFQIWTREIFEKQFSPKWGFLIYEENRIGDNASKLYLAFIQAQGFYNPANWISLSLGYRQTIRRFPLHSNHWEPVYVPLAEVTFAIRPSGWELSDRNRVQYTIFQSASNHWLYRNRIRIISPLKVSRFCLNPFIDNEIFIREEEGFNQDRLSAGLLMQFTGNFFGELYYMCRFMKPFRWIHQNILKINLLWSY